MPRENLNSGRQIGRILPRLADPAGAAMEVAELASIDPARLVSAISYHGIGAVAWRKLKPLADRVDKAWQDAIAAAAERQLQANAIVLELEHRASKLADVFADRNISAKIVKGPDFAEKLYARPSDRVFTDIDFLVADKDIAAASNIMSRSGYIERAHSRSNPPWISREQKWVDPVNPTILIELHTDLVHDRGLRRRLSLRYRELESIPDPRAARFAIAVIHAAAGHKIHKLQLLVDVLQAFRALDCEAMTIAEKAGRAINAQLEAFCCLELVARIFGCPAASQFAQRFGSERGRRLAHSLLAETMVVMAHDDSWQLHRIRRRLFRTLQVYSAPPARPQ